MRKSRRIRWTEHVACVGEMIYEYKVFSQNLERRGLVIDRGIILKWMLK
jgi:hypothetical protein